MVNVGSSLSQPYFEKGITNPLGMARCSCQTPRRAKIETHEMRKAIVIRREEAKEEVSRDQYHSKLSSLSASPALCISLSHLTEDISQLQLNNIQTLSTFCTKKRNPSTERRGSGEI
jgi:hypothetical protein